MVEEQTRKKRPLRMYVEGEKKNTHTVRAKNQTIESRKTQSTCVPSKKPRKTKTFNPYPLQGHPTTPKPNVPSAAQHGSDPVRPFLVPVRLKQEENAKCKMQNAQKTSESSKNPPWNVPRSSEKGRRRKENNARLTEGEGEVQLGGFACK